MAFSESTHWRDSARPAKFFMIDAVAAFPLVLFFLHITWWSFFVAIAAMIFFTVLRRFGFSIPVFLRFVRGFFAGSRKFAIPWWKE
jgi:intracellular multiplication protein IcmT